VSTFMLVPSNTLVSEIASSLRIKSTELWEPILGRLVGEMLVARSIRLDWI